MSARVSRATSNALKVELQVQDEVVAAQATQKGSLGVLFGFKNGGKSSYTLDAKGLQMDIEVAATTAVTRAGALVGRIVGTGTAARIEDGGGTVLADIGQHAGPKSDSAFVMPLTAPGGAPLGTLTLMRTVDGWRTLEDIYDWNWLYEYQSRNLKAPSAGALLRLDAPVNDVLGDLLAAALVDVCVLPRGYVA